MFGPSLVLTVAAAATALIALGLRGRRIEGGPRCATCQYSLAGQPPGSMRCPECGSDLGPHHAVIVSPRARRPRLIALGAAMLSVIAIILGMHTVRWLERVDWQAKKPAAWLAYAAQSSDEDAATAALAELIRRAEQGLLDEDRLRSLAQRGLALQGDLDAPWNPRWGTLIGHANRKGMLTAEERESYLKRAIELAMCPQPPRGSFHGSILSLDERTAAEREAEQRRLGQIVAPLHAPQYECIDIEFVVRSARPGDEMRVVVDARPLHAAIGPWTCLTLPAERSTTVPYSYFAGRANAPRISRIMWMPLVVEPGEYDVRMKWEVRVRFEDDPPESALALELDLTQPLIVEEAKPGALPIVTDAASSEALKAAMKLRAFGFRNHVFRRSPDRVTVIYLLTHAGANQRLREEDVLAPFNGTLDYTVSSAGRDLGRAGTYLPGGWSPLEVPDDSIFSVDVRVRYSESGRSTGIGTGWNIEGTVEPPIWMGPPFTITDIPVTWYETIDEAPLTDEERESIRWHEPR